jgi:predicted transcriptional regulator
MNLDGTSGRVPAQCYDVSLDRHDGVEHSRKHERIITRKNPMARGRRSDKVKAATALELSEKLGHSERQIAKEVGLPASTVHTILSKANGWDQIADEPVFKQNRAQQNRALEQAARSMAAKAMEKAEGKIDEAGFYHLTLGAGIMIDKARLLAGESTENIAIRSREEILKLDLLAAALSEALLARKSGEDK